MAVTTRAANHVDVAIVGGGIVGISTAYYLARQGARVAVFEKGELACEQSSRNRGWIRTLLRDLPEVPAAVRSATLWRELQAQADVGLRESGILYLARDRAQLQSQASWLDRSGFQGARMLDAEATRAMLPPTGVAWSGSLYSATDAVAEPALATAAIAGLAREKGCQVFERTAVRGIRRTGDRVTGLFTEQGEVHADKVLVAGGAWSRMICGNLGVELPQLKVRASVLRAASPASDLDLTVNGGDFTCRRGADGHYVISQFNASYADIVPDSFRLLRQYLPTWLANKALVRLRLGSEFMREWRMPRRFGVDAPTPYERYRVLDPTPARRTAQALEKLTAAFPSFADARILAMWSGYIDVMPDAMPVIEAVASRPGLYVATGFSGHGFGIAPAVGEAMATLMDGRTPAFDLAPFRSDRFRRP